MLHFAETCKSTTEDAFGAMRKAVNNPDWQDFAASKANQKESYSVAPLQRLRERLLRNARRFQNHYLAIAAGIFLASLLLSAPFYPLLFAALAVCTTAAERLGEPLIPSVVQIAAKGLTSIVFYIALLFSAPLAAITAFSLGGSVVVLHAAFRDTNASEKKSDSASMDDDNESEVTHLLRDHEKACADNSSGGEVEPNTADDENTIVIANETTDEDMGAAEKDADA